MKTAPTRTVLIDTNQVVSIVPVCPRTIKRWVGEGLFPKPSRIGRGNFWLASEIDAWLNKQGGAAQA